MFIVVTYDISDNRRRARLHKTLKHFGVGVQESVFECHLSMPQLWQMKAAVEQVIDPQTDEVRYYFLCQECARKNEVTFASKLSSDPKIIIV